LVFAVQIKEVYPPISQIGQNLYNIFDTTAPASQVLDKRINTDVYGFKKRIFTAESAEIAENLDAD